jgi:NTP pyrophosphatase (non-canonical NTP hydrolase)
MTTPVTSRQLFIDAFNAVANEIEDWANRKGWNDDDPRKMDVHLGDRLSSDQIQGLWIAYDISKLGLMVTEIAEAIEGRRHGDPASDKIPSFTSQEEELADCIVRIMHYSAHNKLRVAEALITKLNFNETRPYKHGKQA